MCKTISTLGMEHEEWLRLRKGGIGGSDAGAVCGLNPYRSPMAVYWEKTTDMLDLSDNEAMRQGRDLENYVAQRFTEETGKKVRRSNKMYWSETHPIMYADVDRLLVGEDAGLECKTVSAYNAGKWENGAIPMHYLMQCIHYMAVTGKRTWYIAAVILGVSGAPKERPVVVGAGCAGLFAALTLAEAGLKPLLIERGDPALRRSQAIDLFLKER